MKTEELKEKGLTDEQIAFVMAENGKDIKKLQKEVETITSECDELKERAESAEETLKGFEGKDFDAMQKEVDAWKEKAEQAEKDYADKIAEREKSDLLREAFADIEFTSESAKSAIMARISESITVKNGKLIGFNDLLEEEKKNDAAAFKSSDPEQSRAKFTGGMGSHAGEGQKKLKDMTLDERIALKNSDPELYKAMASE